MKKYIALVVALLTFISCQKEYTVIVYDKLDAFNILGSWEVTTVSSSTAPICCEWLELSSDNEANDLQGRFRAFDNSTYDNKGTFRLFTYGSKLRFSFDNDQRVQNYLFKISENNLTLTEEFSPYQTWTYKRTR